MQIHAKNDRTCIRQHHNLTGLVLTQTESCQSACNQITYRQEIKRLINTSQYSTRLLPEYRGQRPMRLFRAAHRSQVCYCPRQFSTLNEAGYLVRVFRQARWSNETAVVSGVCVLYAQPAEQNSPLLYHLPSRCCFIHDNNIHYQ